MGRPTLTTIKPGYKVGVIKVLAWEDPKGSLGRAVGGSRVDEHIEGANKERDSEQEHLMGSRGLNLVLEGTLHHKERDACAVSKDLVLLAYRQKH